MCFVSPGNDCLKKWSRAIFHVQSNVQCVHSCPRLACGSILKGRLPFPIPPLLKAGYAYMKLVKKTRHNEMRSPGLQALRLHIWSLQHSTDSYLFPGAASGVGTGAWSPWQLPYLTAPGVRCANSWKGCPPRQRGGERITEERRGKQKGGN